MNLFSSFYMQSLLGQYHLVKRLFFFSVYFWLVVKKRDTHRCLSLQYDSTDECVSLYANITPLLLTQFCNTT